jgi:DNA-binding transcriptional LysR family regulator
MELRHLRYFVAVAEESHFGHAAARLNTSQPSLSQQILNLERELKVTLLLRTRRRVELTSAGRRFLQEARGILASAERAAAVAREIARGESRKLVLGVSTTADWGLIGKTRLRFVDYSPGVDVVFQNLGEEAQVAALRDGKIDIGFCGLPIEAGSLTTEITGRVRLVIALPATHRFARRRSVRLEDLADEPYTLWPRHFSPGCYDYLLKVFADAGFGPPVAIEGDLPSARTVLGMVAAGLIVSLVDPDIAGTQRSGVVLKPTTGPGVFLESGVIYRRGMESAAVLAFLEQLHAVLAEREALRPDSKAPAVPVRSKTRRSAREVNRAKTLRSRRA